MADHAHHCFSLCIVSLAENGFIGGGYLFPKTAAIANSTPNAIPSKAANNTCISAGSKNVIVCAGIQKKGMVFLTLTMRHPKNFPKNFGRTAGG
jgi:hypothetical protein